ncbi:MAG: hydrogenase maturation protease [Promethearchaeota archaeon]
MKMEDLLEKILDETNGATKVAIVGIGEEKLTDDAVGPYIISKLLQFNDNKFLIINCGIDMMARMDEIIDFKPSHLIIIDTCTYNAPPGTITILKRKDIKEYIPISSHTIPINIVVDLITDKIPSLKTFMIGIVPESLEGFTELELFEGGKYSIDELNENQDLPFFNIKLTKTISIVADNIINVLIKLIELF